MSDQLNDGSHRNERDRFRESEWTFVRALLSASAHEDKALESFFLQRYSRGDDADLDAVNRYLDDALLQHRRAVEDLKLAREALDEVEQFQSEAESGEYS